MWLSQRFLFLSRQVQDTRCPTCQANTQTTSRSDYFESLFECLQNLIPIEETSHAFCNMDSAVIVCEEATIQEIANAINEQDDLGQEAEEAEAEEEQKNLRWHLRSWL